MKSLKLVFLFFVLQIFSSQAQNKFNVKQTDNNLARISDSLFAYKYECSNNDYRIFITDLIKQGRFEEYKKYEVDSTQWRNPKTYNEPYVLYYHKHPVYENYPVVNITHAAAEAYCKWLTEKYNSDKKKKFKKVAFKLPSENEWKFAANDGDKNKQKRFPVAEAGHFLRGKNGMLLANYLRLDEGNFFKDSSGNIIYGLHPSPNISEIVSINDCYFYTAPVNSFKPTVFGLYNMAGNVAEMLDESGRTKGGSFLSVGGNLKINAPDEYKGFTNGQSQIGFRVFMIVIEK